MNAPIAGASSSGGGSSSLYPDRVDIFMVGQEKVAGFACNTKDMYNDGDTPIYYGEISIEGRGQNVYLYWNGVNWGLDDDLNPGYQAVGPTTKNNVYGTYLAISDGQPDLTVSEYSQVASIECPALPEGGVGESTISSGIVTWSWDGAPVLREPNIWDVTGTITGFTLDNIPADTLTGDFMLTFDSFGSMWSIRNSGSMILSNSAPPPPISTNVEVLSISDATSEDNPSSDLTGTFDAGSINGVVIYNPV